MTITNSNTRIVFSPKDRNFFQGKRRFLISVNRLHVYVGKNNAEMTLNHFSKSSTDKCTVKLRKFGKIEIYNK